jgi:hypothetical protein
VTVRRGSAEGRLRGLAYIVSEQLCLLMQAEIGQDVIVVSLN